MRATCSAPASFWFYVCVKIFFVVVVGQFFVFFYTAQSKYKYPSTADVYFAVRFARMVNKLCSVGRRVAIYHRSFTCFKKIFPAVGVLFLSEDWAAGVFNDAGTLGNIFTRKKSASCARAPNTQGEWGCFKMSDDFFHRF